MTPARDSKQHVNRMSRLSPQIALPDCSLRVVSQGGLQILDSSSQPNPWSPHFPSSPALPRDIGLIRGGVSKLHSPPSN